MKQTQIEYLETAQLIPYARNSRTHSEAQIRQIAASITEFGFTNPVLIDKDNGIIAGHGRVMAAENLNLGQVPCIRLSHLTDAQKRAYIIADNKIALGSEWDEELLVQELTELSELGFDLGLTGFGDFDIDDLDKTDSLNEQKSKTDNGIHYQEKYAVVIECKDSKDQETIYNKLKTMGYNLKLLVN